VSHPTITQVIIRGFASFKAAKASWKVEWGELVVVVLRVKGAIKEKVMGRTIERRLELKLDDTRS
jgi:hypothetical protein